MSQYPKKKPIERPCDARPTSSQARNEPGDGNESPMRSSLDRPEKGDTSTPAAIHKVSDEDAELWRRYGDLSRQAEGVLLHRISGVSPVLAESLPCSPPCRASSLRLGRVRWASLRATIAAQNCIGCFEPEPTDAEIGIPSVLKHPTCESIMTNLCGGY